MSDNWINDFFGERPLRPDHPDMMKVTEVVLKMDGRVDVANMTEDQLEAGFKESLAEVDIDEKVLAYVATQRAFRVLGIETRGQLMAKALETAKIASTWTDGFVAGALFAQKGGSND